MKQKILESIAKVDHLLVSFYSYQNPLHLVVLFVSDSRISLDLRLAS